MLKMIKKALRSFGDQGKNDLERNSPTSFLPRGAHRVIHTVSPQRAHGMMTNEDIRSAVQRMVGDHYDVEVIEREEDYGLRGFDLGVQVLDLERNRALFRTAISSREYASEGEARQGLLRHAREVYEGIKKEENE